MHPGTPATDGACPGHARTTAGYVAVMTTVLPYLLAVLLTPMALALMLFVVARIEGEAS